MSGQYKTRERHNDGTWDSPIAFIDDMFETETAGDLGLALSAAEEVHVTVRLGIGGTFTQPRYVEIIGGEATYPKTVDNQYLDHVSGIGVKTLVSGDTKYAVYLDWVSGAAEIRSASWSSPDDDVNIEVVDHGLSFDEAPAEFALAAALGPMGSYTWLRWNRAQVTTGRWTISGRSGAAAT